MKHGICKRYLEERQPNGSTGDDTDVCVEKLHHHLVAALQETKGRRLIESSDAIGKGENWGITRSLVLWNSIGGTKYVCMYIRPARICCWSDEWDRVRSNKTNKTSDLVILQINNRRKCQTRGESQRMTWGSGTNCCRYIDYFINTALEL